MPLLCKICLEEKCTHWTVQHDTKENKIIYEEKVEGEKSIFGKSSHMVKKERIEQVHEMYFTCYCGKKHVPSKDQIDSYLNNSWICIICSCGNKGLYSKYMEYAIQNQQESFFGCKLTSLCRICNCTGKVITNKSFSICKNCEGTGGIECTECKGIWYTKSKFHGTNQKICNSCTKGFSDICRICNGGKRVVATTEYKDCVCMSKEKWIESQEKEVLSVLQKNRPVSPSILIEQNGNIHCGPESPSKRISALCIDSTN
jgi:hypothetical protein